MEQEVGDMYYEVTRGNEARLDLRLGWQESVGVDGVGRSHMLLTSEDDSQSMRSEQ